VYGGSFMVMSIAFGAINRYILIGRPELLKAELPEDQRRRILARNMAGLGPYVIATALAPVSAYVTLAICGAIAIFYGLPLASGSGAGIRQRRVGVGPARAQE